MASSIILLNFIIMNVCIVNYNSNGRSVKYFAGGLYIGGGTPHRHFPPPPSISFTQKWYKNVENQRRD